MLDFKPIEKEHLNLYQSLFHDDSALGCEYNFVSGYLWSRVYQLKVALFEDNTLVRAYFRDNGAVWGYCMPHGENVAGAVEEILSDAAERGNDVMICYLSQQERDTLETLFPDMFTFAREPYNQDYIYTSRDLATLAGKKFHAKRNHISKFYREYSDFVRFETMERANLIDALQVMKLWCAENNIRVQDHGEYAAFQLACDNFEALQMRGALLYVHDKPVAMAMGCAISQKCFDIMFEKGLRAYDGVYAVINNEFAKTLTQYEYINREEDMGLEGLRKSKLSYHPAIVYDRYTAAIKK